MDPSTAAPTLLQRTAALDAALSLHIHGLSEGVVPRWFLCSLELSSDARVWFPVPLALLTGGKPSLGLLLGSLVDLALLKLLVRRPRPVYNRGMTLVVAVDHWSFPSGHSSRVFFVANAFLHITGYSVLLGLSLGMEYL